jgi:hypothetical protein
VISTRGPTRKPEPYSVLCPQTDLTFTILDDSPAKNCRGVNALASGGQTRTNDASTASNVRPQPGHAASLRLGAPPTGVSSRCPAGLRADTTITLATSSLWREWWNRGCPSGRGSTPTFGAQPWITTGTVFGRIVVFPVVTIRSVSWPACRALAGCVNAKSGHARRSRTAAATQRWPVSPRATCGNGVSRRHPSLRQLPDAATHQD